MILKTSSFFWVVVLTTLFLSPHKIQAQSFDTPVEYMGHISEAWKNIQEDMWDYSRTIAQNKGARKIDKRRQELLNTLKASQNHVGSMSPYEGDRSYRDSVMSYLRLSYLVLNEDYEKIIDLEAVAEESYDAMEAYLLAKQKADEKLSEAFEHLKVGQEQFATKFEINLIEETDEMDEKIERANEVFAYYNRFFLLQFKSAKQELYFVDALNRGDVNAMEQNRSVLTDFANEGLKEARQINPFEGDASLREATIALLNFYKREMHDAPKLINYYLKTENFNNIKKAFDAKPEKKRTQEDVDKYNNAVKEMNEAVEVYNQTNASMNDQRVELINRWNETGQKFTSTYIDKR